MKVAAVAKRQGVHRRFRLGYSEAINLKSVVFLAVILTCRRSIFAQESPASRPSAPPISGKPGSPIELFDGKDLDGWTWVQRTPKAGETLVTIDKVWSVTDGLLHDVGRPIGYIRTTTEYDNYVLNVEQIHLNKGNGGILFAMTGVDKVWPHCLEAQTLTGEEGDIRNIALFKMTMDPARIEPRRLRRIEPNSEKPVGQWEDFQIIVDHGNLTLIVNGQVENVATDAQNLGGRIGLQAEGGEMEFRKVELIPILGADQP
jgi:Domain of Unknown Function (DUF1080)